MKEYNEYITAINKIFDYISKMKAGWTDKDNLNYIESIEEYKTVVVNSLNAFKEPSSKPVNSEMEELGNDW